MHGPARPACRNSASGCLRLGGPGGEVVRVGRIVVEQAVEVHDRLAPMLGRVVLSDCGRDASDLRGHRCRRRPQARRSSDRDESAGLSFRDIGPNAARSGRGRDARLCRLPGPARSGVRGGAPSCDLQRGSDGSRRRSSLEHLGWLAGVRPRLDGDRRTERASVKVRVDLWARSRGTCPGVAHLAYRQLLVRQPRRPGGRVGGWHLWSGSRDLCG